MIPGSEPFSFISAESGSAVICVHGFTSTPYSMRELGSYLASDRLSVYSVLLPGHGTRPEDLERTTWTDWYSAVENKFNELSGKYRQVFLAGQSLGALISLVIASYHNCEGIVAISSGDELKDPLSDLIPLAHPFIRFINKTNGPDIKDPEAKKKEIHYERMPTRSIYEIQKILKLVKKRLPFVMAPVLFIHAAEDHVISVQSMERCFERIGSPVKRKVILRNSYHVATMDFDKNTVQRESKTFIEDFITDDNILQP